MYVALVAAILVGVVVVSLSFIFLTGIVTGIMEGVKENDENLEKKDEDLDAFGRDLADI